MSKDSWCEICGNYKYSAFKHVCPPCFEVCEDHGDPETNNDYGWATIFADDEQEAAETWADRDDAESAEYRCVGGQTIKVIVKDSEGNETRWLVTGEAVPQYTAAKYGGERDGR